MKLCFRPATSVSIALLCAALAAGGTAAAKPGDRQAFKSQDLPDLPYSAAVRAGDTIYVSGVTGHARGSREPVPGGVQAEAEQSLAYIQEALQAAGATMADVAKCTVLLADIDGFPKLNAAYRKFFPSEPPARSTIIVPALPNGSLVEIECNAVVKD